MKNRVAIITREWGFQQQLTLLYVMAVFLFALIGAFVTSWMGGQRDLRNILQQGEQITESFAKQSTLALLYGLGDNAKRGAESTLGFPNVGQVSVYAKHMVLLLDEGTKSDWKPDYKESIPPSNAFLAHETESAWHFIAPVYTHYSDDHVSSPFEIKKTNSEYLGFVQVSIEKSAFHTLQNERFITNFISTFLFAGLMLVLLLWLTSRITKPLNELSELMRRAERGEPGVRAEPVGPHEVLNMSRAFNTMMNVLEQRASMLDQKNAQLIVEMDERKEAEKQLIKYRDHLQDMVDEQTHDLVEARDAALVAERAMSAFLANMSHELRTPLHGILSYANFGINKIETTKKDKILQYFTEIRDSGSRLLFLLNDLLDLSKLRAGKMTYNFQPVDPEDVVHFVIGEFAGVAEEKNVRIDVVKKGEQHAVCMDKDRVAQVVRNILSNALKFSPEEGGISILIRYCPEKALEISISDEGVGIPDDELEFIFQAFSQSSSTRNNAGGTGLGLPICREIIEGGHKGWIKAANHAEKGSVFSFYVPGQGCAND